MSVTAGIVLKHHLPFSRSKSAPRHRGVPLPVQPLGGLTRPKFEPSAEFLHAGIVLGGIHVARGCSAPGLACAVIVEVFVDSHRWMNCTMSTPSRIGSSLLPSASHLVVGRLISPDNCDRRKTRFGAKPRTTRKALPGDVRRIPWHQTDFTEEGDIAYLA